jgi:hypothetical protein
MTEMSDISDRVPSRAEPPDRLTTELDIDDKLLSDILSELYPPKSPYEFSVISNSAHSSWFIVPRTEDRKPGTKNREPGTDEVIRLTAGHQAKIADKPEVRKAGGVHYTPQYIVNYIVKNTIGKLREGGSPARLTNACRYPKMQPMAAQARPDSTEVESFIMSPELPRIPPVNSSTRSSPSRIGRQTNSSASYMGSARTRYESSRTLTADSYQLAASAGCSPKSTSEP